MKQLAKRMGLALPPVRRLYERLQNTIVELDKARRESEKTKAIAEATQRLYEELENSIIELNKAHKKAEAEGENIISEATRRLGNISEFFDKWCDERLVMHARANLFAAKTLQSASKQPSLGIRWDSYSKTLINNIENFDSIIDAVAYAQTEIGFETRPHESQCGDFIDTFITNINAKYPHCADLISRAGESPLSLLTHESGVIKRDGKLLALQQVINVEAFCYTVTKLKTVPRKVLEIGGGYGSSCRDWVNMSQDHLEKYYIIDIPESLFYSEIYLKAHFGSSVVGNLADPRVAERIDDFRIILCPLPLMDLLTNIPIDLAINVGSMQEMSGEWLEYYDHFLSKSQIKNFYSSNYFLQPIQTLNEGMNIFTPRLSAKWELLAHEFMIDTNETECRHVMRGIFTKRPLKNNQECIMKDVALIEDRSPSKPVDTKSGEALFRIILAARNNVTTTTPALLRVLRSMVSNFPYIPKESLYLTRLLLKQGVGLEKTERDEIEQLHSRLEGLLREDRKTVT